MLKNFWEEVNEGEVHERDILQFEFKSDFLFHLGKSEYVQEFFIFIPETLQVNSDTYSKKQFYQDQTNIIRYKTPQFSLKELISSDYLDSPLIKLQTIFYSIDSPYRLVEAEDEIKLFGNIFKVAVRNDVKKLLLELENLQANQTPEVAKKIAGLCFEIAAVTLFYRHLQSIAVKSTHNDQILRKFRYVDEFISNQINHYLLILDQAISKEFFQYFSESQKIINALVLQENLYRKTHSLISHQIKDEQTSKESILYRKGLLNKFVLEALMLENHRFSIPEKHASMIGTIATSVAMFVYLTLFAWKVSSFVVKSFPVILLLVFLYVLKDRIKDWVKKSYSNYVIAKWFPDYSTEITSPKGFKVGKINETFSFISPEKLSEDIQRIRKYSFNEELKSLSRHESIIRYERKITIYPNSSKNAKNRRKELTTFFRLNIYHFIENAKNALQPELSLDSYTHEIQKEFLPKVYHINIIIRTLDKMAAVSTQQFKKFRVIVDKTGIKRVEEIR